MAKRIYFRSMGETMGPVSGEQLRQQAVNGLVTPDTYVRVGDDGEWVKASRLTNLFDRDGQAVGPKSPPPEPTPSPQRESTSWTLPTTVMTIVVGVVLLLAVIWCLSLLM